MFYVKSHKRGYLLDPWRHLGPKRRKTLDSSWPGLFRKKILHALPVELLKKHFHDWNGRPSKELYSMIGLMILQQMHDLTDQQAIEQFQFNIQWHYALDITSSSDTYTYVSLKTLWNTRSKLTTEKIYDEVFSAVLQKVVKMYHYRISP